MSKKVLVVDDDPVVRILVSECLLAKGYEVTVAEGGEQCMQALATSHPDVLVLDCFMPDITGIEIMKRLQADSILSKLPVLMLSADSNSERLLRDNDVKPDAFLEKPVGLDQIVKAVQGISGD